VTSQAGFVVACLICILLAHYAAVLPHEYAHSFMAFALGYKSDPLVIHFGGTSVTNLILLINIDEQVDYAAMFARGDGPAAALTGFAGPGLANGTMYLPSLFLLRQPGVRRHAFLFMATSAISRRGSAYRHGRLWSSWALPRPSPCGSCSRAPCPRRSAALRRILPSDGTSSSP